MIGLFLSYFLDFPAGPTVVSFYGLALLFIALVLHVLRSPKRSSALFHIGIGIVVVFFVTLAFAGAGHYMKQWGWGDAKWIHASCKKKTSLTIKSQKKKLDIKKTSSKVNKQKPPTPRRSWDAQISEIQVLIKSKNKKAYSRLIQFLNHPKVPFFFAGQALDLLKDCSKTTFGYDPEANWSKKQKSITAMKNWLKTHPSSPCKK